MALALLFNALHLLIESSKTKLYLNIGDCYTLNYEIDKDFKRYKVVNKGPKDYLVIEVGSMIEDSWVQTIETLPKDTYKQIVCPEGL